MIGSPPSSPNSSRVETTSSNNREEARSDRSASPSVDADPSQTSSPTHNNPISPPRHRNAVQRYKPGESNTAGSSSSRNANNYVDRAATSSLGHSSQGRSRSTSRSAHNQGNDSNGTSSGTNSTHMTDAERQLHNFTLILANSYDDYDNVPLVFDSSVARPTTTTSYHPLAKALQELLLEDEDTFSARIRRFASYPHPTTPTFPREVLMRFGDCMLQLLKLIRYTGLKSPQEAWRLRLLFMSLPRLLLHVRPSECDQARRRKALAACNSFLKGNLYCRGSRGLFASFNEAYDRPARTSVDTAPSQSSPDSGPSGNQFHRSVNYARAGNLGAAWRVLSSPGVSDLPPEVIHQQLCALHPRRDLPTLDPALYQPIAGNDLEELLESDFFASGAIRRAILGSKNRSAPDQFGWRARELLGQVFLLHDDLDTIWLDHILLPLMIHSGPDSPPQWASAILAGGTLTPLSKGIHKTGIRPVAVGGIPRKILARLLLQPNKKSIGRYFSTTYTNYVQLGVGVPGGTEKAVHMLMLSSDFACHAAPPGAPPSPNDFVIAACDNLNGFNLAMRNLAFDCFKGIASRQYSNVFQVGDKMPSPASLLKHPEAILSLLVSLYGGESTYIFRGSDGIAREVSSTGGFHQGCVLSSFMFSLSVFSVIGEMLKSHPEVLCVSYLDNHFFQGPFCKVLPVLARTRQICDDLDSPLNPKDNFIYVPRWANMQVQDYQSVLDELEQSTPGVIHTASRPITAGFPVVVEGLTALGVPMGTDRYISSFLDRRLGDLRQAMGSLERYPDGRIWASLMRSCISQMPLYHLRIMSPLVLSRLNYLESIDSLFASHVSKYLCWPQNCFDAQDARDHSQSLVPNDAERRRFGYTGPPGTLPASYPYVNAIKQLRTPLTFGGIGLTSADTISAPAFFAALSTSIHWICDDMCQISRHPLLAPLLLCATQPNADIICRSSLLSGWNETRNELLSLRYPPGQRYPSEPARFIMSDTDVDPNVKAKADTILLPSLGSLTWSPFRAGVLPSSDTSSRSRGQPPPAQRILTKARCTFPLRAVGRRLDPHNPLLTIEVRKPNPHHFSSAFGPPDAQNNLSYRQNALRILHLSATRVPVSTPYETRGRSVFPHARAKAKPGFFIQSYPLSFLAVVPVDSVRDAFPRDFFVSFMNMLLGLPRAACYAFGGKPLQGNPGTFCGCGQPFDEDGLHALTCPTWYNRTSVVGHDQVLQSINDLFNSYGIPCTVIESQIPRTETGHPGGTGTRADLYIRKPWGTGANLRPRGTVADLSITHPLDASGTHPDGTTKVGRWWDINRHPEGVNVHSRWGAKKSKHSNYFHHGFFMVPLVASTFGHLHPDFLRFLWNFSQVDHNHPALFDLYRTGEVRHGYCGTDDEATKIQKAIFLKLKARVTSLVARSAASRMLGYTCELEIKHYYRTFPSTHAHYNSYSLLVPSSSLSGGSF